MLPQQCHVDKVSAAAAAELGCSTVNDTVPTVQLSPQSIAMDLVFLRWRLPDGERHPVQTAHIINISPVIAANIPGHEAAMVAPSLQHTPS